MAHSCSSQARSSPRRAANTYAPPSPLEDLHILDFLELTGSQSRAGSALAMHQSTVCRSLQLMQQQFKLEPQQGSPVCRHGHNACLHHLRLAYREHRLMEGLLRIGTDVLHQSLLMGMAGVQLVPPRVRNGEHRDGLAALPLGQLALQAVVGWLWGGTATDGLPGTGRLDQAGSGPEAGFQASTT